MPAINLARAATSAAELLLPRQDDSSSSSHTTLIIPSTYGALDSSPHPGVVAGIVLGAVAGFLFLLFAIYWCLGIGPAVSADHATSIVDGSVLSSVHVRARSRARPVSVRETVEVRTRERVVPGPSRASRAAADPVIVEPPPPRVVSQDSDDSDESDDEDEIVVMEEHSPPRRKSQRRSGSRRSRSRDYYY